jgi:transposase
MNGQTDVNRTSAPAVGEAWAYRARSNDPLVQVVAVRIGVKTPKRVLIRFVDDEFEGRQEWVPPGRLKARWQDVDEFTKRERRWEAVMSASPQADSPEETAAGVIFDLLIDPGLAGLGYNATSGIVTIRDVARLAAHLDLDPYELRADPLSFEEDGCVVAPSSITGLVAKRAAERDPDAVLRYVEREEADARRESIFGRDYRRRGMDSPWHVSAEICAQVDEEHGRPVRAVLRQWCGREAVGLRSELDELRKEVLRLSTVLGSAVDALRRSGAHREAARIERALEPGGAANQLISEFV